MAAAAPADPQPVTRPNLGLRPSPQCPDQRLAEGPEAESRSVARAVPVRREAEKASEGLNAWSEEFRVGPLGIEPRTRGLKVRCSAN